MKTTKTKKLSFIMMLIVIALVLTSCLPEDVAFHDLVVEKEGQGKVLDGEENIILGLEEEFKIIKMEEESYLKVEAIPSEDWAFSHWDGNVENKNKAGTVAIMDEDKMITAVYKKTYSINTEVKGEGEIIVEPDQDEYLDGTEVKITVKPEEDWNFKNWKGDLKDTESLQTTLTVDEEKDITAVLDKIVKIEDIILEQAIRNKLKKPEGEIYLSDANKIKELDVRRQVDWFSLSREGEWIESLEGIQHFKNLRHLALGFNLMAGGPMPGVAGEISDISPLSNLTNLKTLMLGHNQVGDIEPLTNLSNLEKLSFVGNKVNDISPLSNLENLEVLNIRGNEIRDISPLANLTELKILISCYNNINNIKPLSSLSNLKKLLFENNKVEDISSLSKLINLETLSFYNNKVKNITPLIENGGLKNNVSINMVYNYLDLSEGSEDMENIQKLINRGVSVAYEYQWEE